MHWWTWAGSSANRTLQAALEIVDPKQRIGEQQIRLRHGIELREAAAHLRDAEGVEFQDPPVDANALRGLKFSAALPAELAISTVSQRLSDRVGAGQVIRGTRSLRTESQGLGIVDLSVM